MITTQRTSMARYVESLFMGRPNLVVELLTKLGADQIRVMDRSVRSTCPIHNGSRWDAFVVWLDREHPIWACHTDCAAKGGLVSLVMRRYGLDFEPAIMWLAAFVGLDVGEGTVSVPSHIIENDEISQFNRAMGLKGSRSQVKYFPEEMVKQSMLHSHPHFVDRGYDSLVLEHFGVGFVLANTWVWPDPSNPSKLQGWFEDRISIPWRDENGHLIGFAGRRVDGVNIRKYQTLDGTVKSTALYGYWLPEIKRAIKDSRTMVLVEGYADMWRAYMHGVTNCLAVGGNQLSSAQLEIIAAAGVSSVVIYLDGDEPGQAGAANLAKQLQDVVVVKNALPPLGQDPGDMVDKDQFWEPIRQAKSIFI